MSKEILIVRFEDAHTLAQTSCPYCGDPLDWGKNGVHQHVTGFVMACECGTRLCPDFEGERGVQSRSLACEKIADLRSRLARVERNHLRRMISECKNVFSRAVEDSERRSPVYPPASRVLAINARIRRFRDACRAALAAKETW